MQGHNHYGKERNWAEYFSQTLAHWEWYVQCKCYDKQTAPSPPHSPISKPNNNLEIWHPPLLHSLPSLNTLPHMHAYTHTYICMYTHILTSDMSQLTNVNQIVVLNGWKHTSDEKRFPLPVSQNSLGLSTDCVDERNGCRVIRIVYVHIHTPRKGAPLLHERWCRY